MEQDNPSKQMILHWLSDYTTFICDQLRVPHDEGYRHLQQYLELTARGPSHQPVIPVHEQPHPYANASSLQPKESQDHASGLYPGAFSGEEVTSPYSVAVQASHTTPESQHSHHDQRRGYDNMDWGVSGTTVPYLQSAQLPSSSSIGRVADYDPLWVQNENMDPSVVEAFRSKMKLDVLFRDVIKTGDTLIFQVSISADGQERNTEAYLQVRCQWLLRNFVPTLTLLVHRYFNERQREAWAVPRLFHHSVR